MSDNEKPIGVDLEDTLIRFTDPDRTPSGAQIRPGAIVLLEGLRKLGRVPILDTMSDDGRTKEIFRNVPRLKPYFPKERIVTVTNRVKYETWKMDDSPLKRLLEDINDRMGGGKNPREYGADLLIDDMRAPIAEQLLGFKTIQIPSPEDDSTVGWAHKALETIAGVIKR